VFSQAVATYRSAMAAAVAPRKPDGRELPKKDRCSRPFGVDGEVSRNAGCNRGAGTDAVLKETGGRNDDMDGAKLHGKNVSE
jgi:hypothetical protein